MWKLNLSNSDRSSLKSESHDFNRPESPLSGTSSVLDRIRFRSFHSDDEAETSSDSSEWVIIEKAIINQVLDESKLDMTRNARKRTELPGTSKLRFSN